MMLENSDDLVIQQIMRILEDPSGLEKVCLFSGFDLFEPESVEG